MPTKSTAGETLKIKHQSCFQKINYIEKGIIHPLILLDYFLITSASPKRISASPINQNAEARLLLIHARDNQLTRLIVQARGRPNSSSTKIGEYFSRSINICHVFERRLGEKSNKLNKGASIIYARKTNYLFESIVDSSDVITRL